MGYRKDFDHDSGVPKRSQDLLGEGGARERADDGFCAEGKKIVGAKRTLLRRGAADGT